MSCDLRERKLSFLHWFGNQNKSLTYIPWNEDRDIFDLGTVVRSGVYSNLYYLRKRNWRDFHIFLNNGFFFLKSMEANVFIAFFSTMAFLVVAFWSLSRLSAFKKSNKKIDLSEIARAMLTFQRRPHFWPTLNGLFTGENWINCQRSPQYDQTLGWLTEALKALRKCHKFCFIKWIFFTMKSNFFRWLHYFSFKA